MLTVFIPAVTPVLPLPLKVFVVSAGALKTPFSKFLAVILLARVIRYFGEAYLGILLGEMRKRSWRATCGRYWGSRWRWPGRRTW